MHILIVGSPRSRTSYMSSACSNQFKVKNFHEEFDFHFSAFYERIRLLKKPIDLDEVCKKREEYLKNATTDLFSIPGCVIKLFPRHIMTLKYADKILKKVNDLEYKVTENISDIFRFGNYDKIYIMKRNLIDAAMSFTYGKQIGSFLYSPSQKIKSKKVIIKEDVLNELNYFLLETIVLEELEQFINLNYKCINLDYTEAVNYVETEFPDRGQNMYQDTKYNYKELILNYDEVQEYTYKFYDLIKEISKPCNFR
jgi:hypothetical protein